MQTKRHAQSRRPPLPGEGGSPEALPDAGYGLRMSTALTAFLDGSYTMFVPEMPLTENAVSSVDFEILPLLMPQVPLVDVVQLTDDPPTENAPATTALGTGAPLASFTAIVAVARQPFFTGAEVPVRVATDTAIAGVVAAGLPDAAPI